MSQTKVDISNLSDSVIAALATPKIASIDYPGDDTAADPNGGQLITLNGSGFNTGAQVYIDGTVVSVVTVLSSTQLSFISPAKQIGSYELRVINTDGGIAASVNNIEYSGLPVWTTPSGSLGNVYEGSSISTSLSATGDGTVTYSVTSGSLPTGVTLTGNTISGTTSTVIGDTTYNFTIDAIDQELQNTSRNFNIGVLADIVTWDSPANNSTITANNVTAISQALSATALSGSNVTYSANSLPSGLSLSGNTISGTGSVVGNTISLITATSTQSGKTAALTLNFEITDTTIPPGQVTFTTVGTTTWTVPEGVTSISAVCVGGGGRGLAFNNGGGGGGGGDLRYASSLDVTPGETLNIKVGAGGNSSSWTGDFSSISRGSANLLVAAGGGAGRTSSFIGPGDKGGTSTTIGGSIGGGDGGLTDQLSVESRGGGGGGAAGYSGNGGNGASGSIASSGQGGGGGGGASTGVTGYQGGGVQILGQFSNGEGANAFLGLSRYRGGQGSRPDGLTTVTDITYGGGSGGIGNGASTPENGGQGAVRIIWGTNRAYPSTNTLDM